MQPPPPPPHALPPPPHALPAMASPVLVPAIASAYVLYARVLGPRLMRPHAPLALRPFVAAYDALQVVLNAALGVHGLLTMMDGRYSLRCQRVLLTEEDAQDPFSLQVMYIVYYYLLLKIFDLADTVFFVLMKKQSHISFLHVYHHASMVVGTWLVMRVVPGGSNILLAGILNCFVHCAMYLYYLAAALGTSPLQLQHWKRYITILQMGQFLIAALHMAQLLLHNPCQAPFLFILVSIAQSVAFFCLFMNFYVKAYSPKSKQDKKL